MTVFEQPEIDDDVEVGDLEGVRSVMDGSVSQKCCGERDKNVLLRKVKMLLADM